MLFRPKMAKRLKMKKKILSLVVMLVFLFAGQAMAAKYLADNKGKIENQVHTMPVELDMDISARKLAAMGIDIDTLTEEQEKYLNSWEEGT